MELPKNEAVIDFNMTGETTHTQYTGKFTVLCILNMGQKHELELERTRLLADHANPTDGLAGIATILATLRVKIVDGPEWWKQSGGGADIKDEDVLVDLWRQVRDAEIAWRSQVKAAATAKEGTPQGNAPTGSP